MLKKEFRLKPGLLGSANSLSTPFFNVKFGKNGKSLNRFAFIVSKKVDPRATERNLVKRKVRSIIEQIFDNIDSGNDFIFYIREGAKSAKREEIEKEIKNLLKEKNLLK